MPIALLLQEVTAAFRFGERVLEPWIHLVRIEEVLIDRARSAFLFKWFGTSLPLHGFHVRVAIANIEELRLRYEKVKAEVRQRAEGPNLTEPIFGMAGVAAGMILTPGVALGSAIAIVRSLNWHAGALGVALRVLFSIFLIGVSPFVGGLTVLLSPALAAGGFVGYLKMGVSNAPDLRATFDLLGGLAKLLESATRFIKLLLGPRSEINNPILKGMLHLFDQLAKLFPFGLALVAVLVTRFGPLLLPLAATMRAFGDLINNILDTITFIFNDFVEQLKALFMGPDNIVSPLEHILGRLTDVFPKVVLTFNDLLDMATTTLENWYMEVQKKIKDWDKSFTDIFPGSGFVALVRLLINKPAKSKGLFESLGDNLTKLIKYDPTLVKIDYMLIAFTIAGRMFQVPSKKKAEEEEKKASIFDPFAENAKKWAAEAERAGKTLPDFPTFESPGEMMDRLGLESKYGIPKDKKDKKKDEGRYDELIKKAEEALPPVSEAVTKYVERARHPTSAFAYEKKARAAEYGAKTLPEALAKAHKDEIELRNALEAVVARVLPSELRHLLIPLSGAFGMLDETLTLDKKKAGGKSKKGGGKETPKPEFPVKDLPEDNGLLRPVVQRLYIHSKSGRRGDLQDFLQMLQKKLDRPYPAPA